MTFKTLEWLKKVDESCGDEEIVEPGKSLLVSETLPCGWILNFAYFVNE